MEYVCPACHSELDPTNTQCPTCLRPISRHEMVKALQSSRKEQEARRQRPKRIAAIIGLVVLAGYLIQQAEKQGIFQKLLASIHTQPAAAIKAQSMPPVQSPPPQPIPPPQPMPPPMPAPMPAPYMPPQSVVQSPRPGEPRTNEPSEPNEPAKPPEPQDWAVHGTVYDLITLKSCAGARLSFEDHSTGEVYKAKADAHGRYKIRLPKLSELQGGYRVTVTANGYLGDFLEEGNPPFSSRTRAGREEAAADAAQTPEMHVPIFLDKASNLEYNLALLPH
jgi:type IV secretory pathway VirB10-like protein